MKNKANTANDLSYRSLPFVLASKRICNFWGFKTMVDLVWKPRILGRFIKRNWYDEEFQKWIDRTFSKSELFQSSTSESSIPKDYVIWTLWWQGEENMPQIIKECRQSLLNNANGHRVILVNKDNYKQYITLPKHIEEKFISGKISFAHFSDIIRLSLLAKYGGLWVDSAIYVLRPIEAEGNLYTINIGKEAGPSIGKFCIALIACHKNYSPICTILNYLLEYWKQYDEVIEYLMFDEFVRYVYNHDKCFKRDVDKIPTNSPDLHYSRYTFDKIADEKIFLRIVENNQFLSFTWRKSYPEKKDGKYTYYGLLKKYCEQTNE